MQLPIYLDYSATTPCDPRVVAAMLPYFSEDFGNAASRSHSFGWKAEEAVEQAREQVAALIGSESKEIIFTSGATESVNLALKGVFETYASKGKHIITCAIEHKAVLDTCKHLEKNGAEISYIPVNHDGLVDPLQIEAAIRPDTILISLMYANNEIGTIMPVADIGRLAHQHGILFFTDATQAVGKIKVDVQQDHIDLLAMNAHKIYGPKGVGALYVRRKDPRVRLSAQMDGGGHEKGWRSGTLNVPGIVGLGKACAICIEEMQDESSRLKKWRDRLETSLLQLEETRVNGSRINRLPQVTNLSFQYADGQALLMEFGKEIALSSGSACTSASLEPSYVLKALGLADELAHSSLRFSLGRFTTEEEIDFVIKRVCEGVQKLRALSPLWDMHKKELI
ncbi:MAG: IscS subfamily cysteine desulfurase [Flavisolibacter sp.]